MQSFLILYKALKSVMVRFDSNPLSYKGKPQLNCLKHKEIYLICHFSPPIQLVDYITKHRYWFLCLLLLLLLPLWIGTLLSWPRTVNCHWIIPNLQITDYCTDQFTGIVGHGTNGLLCCLFYISFSFFSSLACFRDSIAMYLIVDTASLLISADQLRMDGGLSVHQQPQVLVLTALVVC